MEAALESFSLYFFSELHETKTMVSIACLLYTSVPDQVLPAKLMTDRLDGRH